MLAFLDPIKDFFLQMFQAASPQEKEINHLFLYYNILGLLIVITVTVFILIGIIKYRYRGPGDNRAPEQSFGNIRLELLWTIIPLFAVIFFLVLTIRTMNRINNPSVGGQAPFVVIVAHQWWWEFHYPGNDVITAGELHIPVNQRLLMRINSADVIHSWWVPPLGRKTDAIPGRDNYQWIDADSVGEYKGRCSTFCGAHHSAMLISVFAQTENDFSTWVANEKKEAATPTTLSEIKGSAIFQAKCCGTCHTIRPLSGGRVAPDLTHIGSRTTLLSGTLPNTLSNMKLWLKETQKVKMGAHMPNFNLSNEEIDNLSDYMEALK